MAMSISLVGCGAAYRSVNGVRIQGKNVDAKYSQLTQTFSFVGEQVQATILRQSAFTSEKVALNRPEIFNLPSVKEGQLSFSLDQNGQIVPIQDTPLKAVIKVAPNK